MIEPSPHLVETGGGFSLRYGDRWLYSRYQPQLTAEKVALDTPVEPDTLYLVPSPCLCHGLAMLSARLPESSAVLAIELETSLLAVAKDLFAAQKLDPARFRLCTSTNPGTILTMAFELGKFRRIKEVRLSGGRDLHPREYDGLVETITINNRIAWRNRMTLVRLGRLWVKNVVDNLARLPWEQMVTPLTIQRPIMLCGAGPSLNHVLPWIKKHSRHLTIMAVDTAAGALAQAGILPDQVVCLEAQAHNLPDFTPLAGMELTMVADISAHPASFRIVRGPKILVSSQWMHNRFLVRLSSAGLPLQPVQPLGSVGVLAARLAVQQRQTIFIAGLDFAFLRGITHCTGSPSDLAERRLETRLYKHNKQWDLSCSHGVLPLIGGGLGNAVLSMYAACAGIELDGAEVYDLRGGFGLPLPATAISLDHAEELLAATIPTTEHPGSDCIERDIIRAEEQDVGNSIGHDATDGPSNIAPCMRADTYKSAARAFLENELDLAKELASRLNSSGEDSLVEIIRDCDYMYAHFPDPERVEAMELDALKRLAVEAGYWQHRIQVALETSRS